MPTKVLLVVVVVALLGQAPTLGQESTHASEVEQFIRATVDDYCNAFNNRDIESLMTYWASDADYVDAAGTAHRGKEAIEALFRSVFERMEAPRLELRIERLRMVTPDVAIEDGVASFADSNNEPSSGRYTVVWVKQDDAWLISSARELPSPNTETDESTDSANPLEELEWMVGEWVSEDDNPMVSLSTTWALDKAFLVQDFVVSRETEADMRVVQWIGFDPTSEQFRTWTFDSLGGFGEGVFSRDGDTWQGETSGVLPDGRVGGALSSISYVDDMRMERRATGRHIEGLQMPDAVVRFVRVQVADESASEDKAP